MDLMNQGGIWPAVTPPEVQESMSPEALRAAIFIAGFAMAFGGLVSFLVG